MLATAAVVVFEKNIAAAKKLAMAGHLLALALSAMMLEYSARAPISVLVGPEPWNFYVLVMPLDAFMVFLFVGISTIIVWASFSMIEHDIEPGRVPAYYALICALVATLCGVAIFENFFNIFLLLELSSFAAVGIVIIKKKPENMKAGLKYLTLSILGSSFILMGIIIMYFVTDSLSIIGVQASLTDFTGYEESVRNALIFIAIGTALKSALFPLHIWLPDAHGTAPSPSSAILSGLVLKAYIFLYIKILYKAVGAETLASDPVLAQMQAIMMIAGVVAMLAGSAFALAQTDIKRMIAYSSVAQIGYIFMGIGMGTRAGLFAAMFHILAHAVTKPLLFLVAGGIIEQTHNRAIAGMGGLGYKMRISMALFTLGALSMVGIPLFIGFNSKWYFAEAIIYAEHFWILGALAFSALLNGSYYLPVSVRAFFGREAVEAAAANVSVERPLKDLAPVICFAVLIVALALFSWPVTAYLHMGIDAIW